jgi:hypothetical protein
MTAKGWFVVALVAGGATFAVKTTAGCLNKPAPDQKLAGRLEDLCDIARDGIARPEAGMRALVTYTSKHLGDLLGDFGDTVGLIERITDDEAHDERARMARDRLRAPVFVCIRDWQRFGDAVEEDPAAKAVLNNAMIRLNRTFEILFGDRRWTLRDLPIQLEHALDTL